LPDLLGGEKSSGRTARLAAQDRAERLDRDGVASLRRALAVVGAPSSAKALVHE